MTYYDEQLKQLQQQVARKKHLDAMLTELYYQRRTLSERAAELEAVMLKEQADVDRLEGRSLAAFFYGVISKMDERLDKEREEAYAAKVKYDAAARELASVEEDVQRHEAELRSLADCEKRYEQVLREKAEAIKASGEGVAADILRLEERIAAIGNQKREIREAISAGNAALSTAESILNSLGSADSWATWDLFGGGLISDLAKHSHLDDAQGMVEHLQVQLRRFKTELADVTIHADLQVSIDGFLRFADYFFDGLFADWAVKDQIYQSQRRVEQTASQIESVLHRLNTMLANAEQEQKRAREELDALVLAH